MNISELNKQIITLLDSNSIQCDNIPFEDIKIFGNYKIFPRQILVKADWNYKEEDEFVSQKLVNNLKKNGQIENIHVRKLKTGYYEVVNGNHRLDACDVIDKKNIIAYDHGEISLTEAQLIAIETNETKFKSNQERLSILIQNIRLEIPDEELRFTLPYNDEVFNSFLDFSDSNSINLTNEAIVEDDYDEPISRIPHTKLGDIYEFNGHRLMCGDSTSIDVSKLMNGKLAHMLHTDPPYNVKYAELNKTRTDNGKDWSDQYCTEWNDDMSDEDYKSFLFNFIKNAKKHMIEWAHYYIWHATTYYSELLDAMDQNNIPYDKVPIQWVKQVAPLSWVRYKRKNEPCLYAGKGAINGNGEGARWFGPNNESTIWNYDREHNGKYIHPTQKPVGLPARAITNSSQAGEIVLELFGGSGSTLIAADQLKRYCYTMELSPGFCDGILKRYVKYCKENNINIEYFKKNNNDYDYNQLGE